MNKETGEVKEQEIYLGDYPWMTDRATFVINALLTFRGFVLSLSMTFPSIDIPGLRVDPDSAI